MPIFVAFATIGVGLFSFLSGQQAQEENQQLAEETIKFGKEELSQQNDQFLAALGITKEELDLKQEFFGFQKTEAAKGRIEREKDRKIKQRQFGAQATIDMFKTGTDLESRMLGMWGNTGFVGSGGRAGTPPAQPAPAGEGVFNAA